MKKPKKREKRKNNKKNSIVIWGGLAIALFMLVVGGRWFVVHNDAQRFVEADQKKDAAFSQLVEKIGSPLRTEERNVCYRTEHEPYNNGRLWCQVASVAFFSKSEHPESEIRNLLNDIVSANAWKSTNKRPGPGAFEGSREVPCELLVEDGQYASRPGRFFSSNQESKLAVAIVCSSRSEAKHYEYLD